MKKILFVIMILIFVSAYARNIEYNADGSITVISNGNRTKVNMDGKTPLGTTIESVTWTVNRENPAITFVYSAELSDDDLPEKVRNIIDNTSALLLREIRQNKPKKLNDLRVVFSYCRYTKIGHCKRSGKKDFTVTFYEKNKKYAEFSVSYRETQRSDAETTLPTLIVKQALRK